MTDTNTTECIHDDGRGSPHERAADQDVNATSGERTTERASEQRTSAAPSSSGVVCDETVIGDDGATVDTLKE